MTFENGAGKKRDSVFTFVVDGDKLTGTEVQDGRTRGIRGEVHDSEIQFSLVRDRTNTVVHYTGHLEGDGIRFDVKAEGEAETYHTEAHRE